MDAIRARDGARGESLAGIGGIVFGVVLLLWFFQLLNTVPAEDAGAQEWLTFMTDDPGLWLLYAILVGVGLMAFLWCLGSIRSILARAEGGGGRLSTVAFGAGVLVIGLLAVSVGLMGAVPLAAQYLVAFEPDPHMGLVLIGAAGIVLPYAAMAGGILGIVSAVVILRTRVFPAWFGWLSLVAGLAIFAAAIVDFTILLLPAWAIFFGAMIMTGVGNGRRSPDRAVTPTPATTEPLG